MRIQPKNFELPRPKIFPIFLIAFLGCLIFSDYQYHAYSSEKGSWTTLAPALTKRSEVALATVRGKIYMIGGFLKPTFFNYFYSRFRNKSSLEITALVEEYDPILDQWSPRASLPFGVHHAAAGAVGNMLYVVGGFKEKRPTPLDALFQYDPTTDTWTERKSMPTPRGALAVTSYAGKLFAIGGKNYEGNSEAVEVYDPKRDIWESRAPLPTPRDHLAAVTANGLIYTIGGRLGDLSRNVASVEVYDPLSDTWETLQDLPTPRSGIAAGVIGNKFFVLGGENLKQTFSENESYDVNLGRWEKMSPMPTARHGLGAVSLNNRLYVISGGPTPGGSSGQQFSDLNEVFTPPF